MAYLRSKVLTVKNQPHAGGWKRDANVARVRVAYGVLREHSRLYSHRSSTEVRTLDLKAADRFLSNRTSLMLVLR